MTETIDDPQFDDLNYSVPSSVFVDECERRGVFTEGELEDPNAQLADIAITRLNQRRLKPGLVWVRTDDDHVRLMSDEVAKILKNLREARKIIDSTLLRLEQMR